MSKPPARLEAYLDEACPRRKWRGSSTPCATNPEYIDELASINARRNAGMHTLGEIWRRHRLSCPSRRAVGQLSARRPARRRGRPRAFHVETIGCRLCRASLTGLGNREKEAPQEVETRRRKYFQSSAGYLGEKRG